MAALSGFFVVLLALACALGVPSRVSAEPQSPCPDVGCVDSGATACGTSGCRALAVPDHQQRPPGVTSDGCPTNCDALLQGQCPGANCFAGSTACPGSGCITSRSESTCTGPGCAATDLPGPCIGPNCHLDPWMYAAGTAAAVQSRQALTDQACRPLPLAQSAAALSRRVNAPNGSCLATPDACPSPSCITSAATAECIGRNCSVDDAFGVHRFELRFGYIDAPLTLNRVLTAGCPTGSCAAVPHHGCRSGSCLAISVACPNSGCVAGSVEQFADGSPSASPSRR